MIVNDKAGSCPKNIQITEHLKGVIFKTTLQLKPHCPNEDNYVYNAKKQTTNEKKITLKTSVKQQIKLK